MSSFLSGIGDLFTLGKSLFGGDPAKREARRQEQFAQMGIRWKVADAQAAGVHPLYALGAPTISYQPQSVGGGGYSSGTDLSALGQDIGRAIDSGRTRGEKVDAYTQSLRALTLQKFGLENELLSSQIAKLNQAPSPGLPGSRYLIDGQPSSGLVVNSPLDRTAPGEKRSQEPGAITESGFTWTGTGMAPVPSYDAKQRIEDQIIPELLWSVRNNLIPSFSGEGAALRAPPAKYLKPGMEWYFNPWYQEYQQVPKKKKKGFIGPARGMPSVERR